MIVRGCDKYGAYSFVEVVRRDDLAWEGVQVFWKL